jgi:hypothetical protein
MSRRAKKGEGGVNHAKIELNHKCPNLWSAVLGSINNGVVTAFPVND